MGDVMSCEYHKPIILGFFENNREGIRCMTCNQIISYSDNFHPDLWEQIKRVHVKDYQE
jgi:hypothetical protein